MMILMNFANLIIFDDLIIFCEFDEFWQALSPCQNFGEKIFNAAIHF